MSEQVSYVALGWIDLLIGAALLLIVGGLSLWARLGVERRLAIASARMLAQLTVMGFVLRWLFTHADPWLTALAAVMMLGFAGREVTARQTRRLKGAWSWGLGTSSMAVAAVTVSAFALTTQIQPDPWYDPRYALPILGMILGNTMTGVALGLETLTQATTDRKRGIEAQLALGAPRKEAFRPVVRHALRAGLMPIVNSMAAVGLVFIPGMMTGQLLAGVDPLDAARYQILIMFLIAGGTALGTATAVLTCMRRLSDDRHRLRLDRLTTAGD